LAKILLNKKNLFHNFEVISNQAGSVEKVAVVLKDNAYGHGLLEIATLAREFGIKKAVVKSLEEALVIEKLFDDIVILAQKDVHTYSHTFHIALNSLEAIKNLPENINVHIKVDTGMHRNGIMPESLEEAFLGLSKKNIKVTGVFTHHRGSDELSTDFYWQKAVFTRVKKDVKKICEKLSLPLPAIPTLAKSSSKFEVLKSAAELQEWKAGRGKESFSHIFFTSFFTLVKTAFCQ
jgi:alanine racemase